MIDDSISLMNQIYPKLWITQGKIENQQQQTKMQTKVLVSKKTNAGSKSTKMKK